MDKEKYIGYPVFGPFKELLSFTTTRFSGLGNLPRFTGDDEQIYSKSRALLAKNLHLDVGQLVFPRQTHSCNVKIIDALPGTEIGGTDALITAARNICICVQTADCVPVMLYDPKLKIIAVIHAGWRGIANRIILETVMQMTTHFGSAPENIVAAIGPSIGPGVYVVGPEVALQVEQSLPFASEILIGKSPSAIYLNLWKAAEKTLELAGLRQHAIYSLSECTFAKPEKYYSARREGVATGRLVSGIMLY